MVRRLNEVHKSRVQDDIIGIRTLPNPDGSEHEPIEHNPRKTLSSDMERLYADNSLNLGSFSHFQRLSSDRNLAYKAFEEMARDATVSAALEMYADDSTQYDSMSRVIWAEGDDTDVVKFANGIIDALDLNKKAWSHVHHLVTYGDLYLETFKDDEIDGNDPVIDTSLLGLNVTVKKSHLGAVLLKYINKYPDPADIFDLTKYGKTVGFIKTNNVNGCEGNYGGQVNYQMNIDEVEVLRPDKFIHITLGENESRCPETVTISTDGGTQYTYEVKRGKSLLQDGYGLYKMLKLLEDAILLNRITRSSITRVIQVEVGESPPDTQREQMRKIKQLFEQKNYMDTDEGTFSNFSVSQPIENFIYIPTHEGKGQLSMSNVGGDVDIKSIIDLDYFKNKFYGFLRVPRGYLGDDMEGSGLSNGGSLTKLSAQYAHAVKKIQIAYIEGITTLINNYAVVMGLADSHVDNFTIKMTSPSTVEDDERDATLQTHIDIANNLYSLATNSDVALTDDTKKKILTYLIGTIVGDDTVSGLITEDKYEEELEDDDNAGVDDRDDFGGGMSTPPPSTARGELDFDDDNTDTDDTDFEFDTDFDTEAGEETDTSGEPTDFGDF